MLNKGKTAMVSDADYWRVAPYKWRVSLDRGIWYAVTNIDGRVVKMHVFLMREALGPLIDHKDRNGLNNTRFNLRSANKSTNAANAIAHCDGSSRFKGVTWDKANSKWRAQICVNGKRMALGRFEQEDDAARAYNAAAITHFGPFARINSGV